MDPFKVNFIGIGAAKSGTTWLADMLRQHPDVFIPKAKELHYFNKSYAGLKNPRYNKSLKWYSSFFKLAKHDQIKGEISPTYLRGKNCAKDIYAYNPDIKLIVILRNPVERIFSHYLFLRQTSIINKISFEEFFNRKKFKTLRFYYTNLKRYFDIFPKENILVLLFDDLKKDPVTLLKLVENFLEIKEFVPDNIHERSNVTGIPKFRFFDFAIYSGRAFLRRYRLDFVRKILRYLGISGKIGNLCVKNVKPFKNKPQLDQITKTNLKKYFKEDIEQTELLLDKDLSQWK